MQAVQRSDIEMTAEEHMEELLMVVLFAGIGGTNDLVGATLEFILRDPVKYVEMFRKGTCVMCVMSRVQIIYIIDHIS